MLEEPKIEIRYSPIFSGVLIVSALVLFGFHLDEPHPARLVFGIATFVCGVQTYRIPACRIYATHLELRNYIGILLYRMDFASISEFELDAKGRLWHTGWTSKRGRLLFPKVGLRRADLNRFRRAIEARAFV
jgi:hypothetical protein